MSRALAYRELGYYQKKIGEDPRESFQKAIDDFEMVLRYQPGRYSAHKRRGSLSHLLGGEKAARGLDPFGDYREAMKDYERALRTKPKYWMLHNSRGIIYERSGRFEEAADAYGKALKYCGSKEEDSVRRSCERTKNMAKAPAWYQKIAMASNEFATSGHYGRARRLYVEGLSEARDAGATDTPKFRPIFARAHYRLGLILALMSGGKTASKAVLSPLPPDESEALRKEAVEHLLKAEDFGDTDVGRISGEASLKPVRDVPEFKALMKALGEGLAKRKPGEDE
jgi:tetratricopeptide (TPR) repeat protein